MSPVLIGIVVAVVFLGLLIVNAIRILPEYERGVVFRLGRLRPTDYGPGLFLLIPLALLRVVTPEHKPQWLLTWK